MGQNSKTKAVKARKRSLDHEEVAEETELNDLGNSKQTMKRRIEVKSNHEKGEKGKRKETKLKAKEVKAQVHQVVERDAENESKDNFREECRKVDENCRSRSESPRHSRRQNTAMSFIEDDETVHMEVDGQQEEFMNETEEMNEDEKEISSEEEEEDNGSEGELKKSSDEDEHEVSFLANANKSNSGESWNSKTKALKDLDISQEEEESMMEFARFLESNGYIKKAGSSENEMVTKKVSNKDDSQNGWKIIDDRNMQRGELTKVKGKHKNINSNSDTNSELTIYKEVVPMETSSSDSDSEEKNRKQISSSEDEINTSDEMLSEVNQQMKTRLLNDNERFMYEQIVHYRLKEQRERIRNEKAADRGRAAIPGTSGVRQQQQLRPFQPQETVDERAKQMIQQAEAARAKLYEVPGKEKFPSL